MATTNKVTCVCFKYPTNTRLPLHTAMMEELARYLNTGWVIQGSPYMVNHGEKGDPATLSPDWPAEAQVLLVQVKE